MSMPMDAISGQSAPGPMAQTTGQPMRPVTGLPYGDAGKLMAQQAAAPMSASPSVPPPPPLHAPTQRPGEPVTHGADAGPGADSSILNAMPGPPATGGAVSQAIAKAAASDTSGVLQQLLIAAQSRGL